jgi:hypothetical protein
VKPDGPSEFDPAAIIEALDRHGVRYVLIGGVASVLHGAPTVTTDIDLVPERSADNLRRLVECLHELGAWRVTDPTEGPSRPSAEDLRHRIELFDTTAGPVDVVFEAQRIGGYERLVANATPMQVGRTRVLVASLDDLIMGKQWSDRAKDQTHLRLLLAVKRERYDADPA